MSTSSPGFGVPLHLASPYRGRGCALRIVRSLAAVQHTAGPIEGPYPVITGDYSGTPRWESRPVQVGTPVAKPTPVFTKLDPSVVDEELARMGA